MHSYSSRNSSLQVAAIVCAAVAVVSWDSAAATRIKDLCEVQGVRGNHVSGMGLVVGLAGTGDKSPLALEALEQVLRRSGIEVKSASSLKSANVAVVAVEGVLPAFAKEGTRIDVTVKSISDAKSLEGGSLLSTLLLGADGEAYAMAQGPISTGGFNADTGGASVRLNHVTVGRIPLGAYVEREVPSTITDGERIMLLLKQPDFGTARNIEEVINKEFEAASSSALGGGSVLVMVPEESRPRLVEFIARVQDLSVEIDMPSRIVINERTGTIVVGGEVQIRPCQVAHGSLTLTVANTPQVSQPLPFSDGATTQTQTTDMQVVNPDVSLMPVEGTSAAEVAESLNRLKTTPRDMISIFQALKAAGVLDADIEIM